MDGDELSNNEIDVRYVGGYNKGVPLVDGRCGISKCATYIGGCGMIGVFF